MTYTVRYGTEYPDDIFVKTDIYIDVVIDIVQWKEIETKNHSTVE